MWTWPLWGLESTGQLLPKMIWIILWLKVLLCYLMHFNKNGNGKLCNQCHSTASLTNWFPVWLIIRVLIKEWHKLFHPSEICYLCPQSKAPPPWGHFCYHYCHCCCWQAPGRWSLWGTSPRICRRRKDVLSDWIIHRKCFVFVSENVTTWILQVPKFWPAVL